MRIRYGRLRRRFRPLLAVETDPRDGKKVSQELCRGLYKGRRGSGGAFVGLNKKHTRTLMRPRMEVYAR